VKILSRYVLKEHLGPLTFALTALTSLLLLNYIAKRFGELVGKGLPWSAIAEFFLLSVPFTVELTLPMAVLVATLHAFSRLAAENEVTALKASGVSLRSVMVPVMIAAAGVTLFMIIFNDQIIPRTNHELAVLQSDIAQKKPTFALREQVINEVSPGKLFLRANHLDEASNRMREVTIYDMSDPTRRRTIYADSGNIVLARNQSDLLMTLYHGTMQDVPTNDPAQLQRLFFTTDLVTVKGVANQFQQSQGDQSKGNREMSVCEMQRQVERQRADYLDARKQFLHGLAMAKAKGVQLDPSVYATDTKVPSDVTLGGLYCSFLHTIGVRSLGAQTPAPPQKGGQLPIGHRLGMTPGATTSAQRVPGKPAPVKQAPPPIPADAQRTPAGRISASELPPSAGMQITPSLIEVARLQMQEKQSQMDSNEVEIHKKFAIAVACMVFVMLGAPIALRFPRGGVGLTIGASLFVFALYYIGLTAGASLATQGILPAWVAMWAANVIFAGVAVWLLMKMGNEGTTARGGDLGEMIDRMRGWWKARNDRRAAATERRTSEQPAS